MDLQSLRREYLKGGLNRENLVDDPLDQFRLWMKQAVEAETVDPTAMTLATVDETGQPFQRVVLLKQLDQGFVFYTNLGSKKAGHIAVNPKVSLHFAWLALERQVKIAGVAEKLSTSEVLRYFVSRPRESQLAAWASPQSKPLSSRDILEQSFARMKEKFGKGEIPLPDFWGGYRVIPSQVEFWQGGAHRLHDRFEYRHQQTGWSIERLAP